MKKVSVVLNVVLIAAVAVIYILHFTGRGTSVKAGNDELNLPVEVTSHGIAFVNIDSVILKFAMYTDKRAELVEKQKRSETELTSKGQAYEKGVLDYQDKVRKGLVTRATAEQMEQSLMQQQQSLVDLRDKLSYDLMEEEQVMNRQILEYITAYLDLMKDEYNFQYIIGRSFGGPVLYSDEALNISDMVVEGINRKYTAEKGTSKK